MSFEAWSLTESLSLERLANLNASESDVATIRLALTPVLSPESNIVADVKTLTLDLSNWSRNYVAGICDGNWGNN